MPGGAQLPHSPHRLEFDFAGYIIAVEAPASLLAWLEEFLRPQFSVIRGAAPDRTIRFAIDSQEHERLLARGSHPRGGQIECFTLDSGIHSGTRWNDSDETVTAFDEMARVFYRGRLNARDTIEAVAAEDTAAVRVALMRMVREFAMAHAARTGWLLVHAAAVQFGDKAVVIAGPKGSGKTTLLLHALTEGGSYISNDRVAIRLIGEHAFVQGIPTIAVVREGSIARFPSAAARFARGCYDFSLLLEQCRRARRVPQSDGAQKWQLSPPQLCDLFDVASRGGARLSALVFPERVGESTRTSFVELPSADVEPALMGARLRPSPRSGVFSIDAPSDSEASDSAAGLPARLAAALPGFRCHLGTAAGTEVSRIFKALAL